MFHDDKELYEFSDFRLDISERLLLRKDKRVPLSEKAFEMLCVLIRQSGHLVSKDELLTKVWADTIVEENNLDKNISLLRRVLGGRKDKEKFIETVRGRGYRFLPEVRRIEVESQNESQISNLKSQNGNANGNQQPTTYEQQIIEDQKPIIKDPPAKSASRNSQSNNVIVLADWRHEAEADEKSSEVILTPAQMTEFSVAKRRNFPLVGAIVLGLLVLALGFFAFTRFRSETPTANTPITTIAILPFDNASGDANLNYLSDGLSESVIDKLSQLPQLKVIARSSSFKYRGENIDVQDAANKLGVQAIVMGKVVQRGDSLIVRVEMIDARDNRQLWGEQYNRRAADALAVQQEIAQTVSEKLRSKLSGAQQQFVRRETVNPQAFELLLRGQFYSNKGGTENRQKANEYFLQAIAVDPGYALAYVKLSNSYLILVGSSLLDPKEFLPKAKTAARKALELNENLAEAHLVMADLYQNAWDWAAAEAEYKRAVELNSNLSEAHLKYSKYLRIIGRHDQAIAEIKRARELDPLGLYTNLIVSDILFTARRYDEAIAEIKKILELDENYILAYNGLGFIYAAKGMYREAITAYQKAISLGEDSPSMQIYLGAAYARAGERQKALGILKRLEISKEYVSPGELPVLYAALGEREKAFASFEKAFVAHDSQLQNLKIDPAFDSLRDDPRFKDLLRRVGLPQ